MSPAPAPAPLPDGFAPVVARPVAQLHRPDFARGAILRFDATERRSPHRHVVHYFATRAGYPGALLVSLLGDRHLTDQLRRVPSGTVIFLRYEGRLAPGAHAWTVSRWIGGTAQDLARRLAQLDAMNATEAIEHAARNALAHQERVRAEALASLTPFPTRSS